MNRNKQAKKNLLSIDFSYNTIFYYTVYLRLTKIYFNYNTALKSQQKEEKRKKKAMKFTSYKQKKKINYFNFFNDVTVFQTF